MDKSRAEDAEREHGRDNMKWRIRINKNKEIIDWDKDETRREDAEEEMMEGI